MSRENTKKETSVSNLKGEATITIGRTSNDELKEHQENYRADVARAETLRIPLTVPGGFNPGENLILSTSCSVYTEAEKRELESFRNILKSRVKSDYEWLIMTKLIEAKSKGEVLLLVRTLDAMYGD